MKQLGCDWDMNWKRDKLYLHNISKVDYTVQVQAFVSMESFVFRAKFRSWSPASQANLLQQQQHSGAPCTSFSWLNDTISISYLQNLPSFTCKALFKGFYGNSIFAFMLVKPRYVSGNLASCSCSYRQWTVCDLSCNLSSKFQNLITVSLHCLLHKCIQTSAKIWLICNVISRVSSPMQDMQWMSSYDPGGKNGVLNKCGRCNARELLSGAPMNQMLRRHCTLFWALHSSSSWGHCCCCCCSRWEKATTFLQSSCQARASWR